MAVTSGIGPVEPGQDTDAWDARDIPRPRRRPARLLRRHPRTALTGAAALAALAAGVLLYAGRPRQAPAPPAPYPAQAVGLDYLDAAPGGAGRNGFRFTVRLSVRSGPPVTVTRIAQPSAGLSVTSAPAAPFQTKSHSSRKIIVTLRVTDCEMAPRNPGLPFLDVTLRNTRAMQAHSFILGRSYARHLSRALEVACSNDSR
ncbi:Tat pathway signal sequence domain protein [Streptomyces sp. NPDC008313]|uniref:Tat pathway signal sequence domain protein n=1 Tax=Streptomyces sp. NPDC008313 TaxID=3364826 RepID=UPI0036F16EBA